MAGYVLKIVLEDTHPPVWRRVTVPDTITFAGLHKIIQVIFGWEDCHLHEFYIPSEDIRIGTDDDDWDFGDGVDCDEREVLLKEFIWDSSWFKYVYDFGDNWSHKIIYEKTDENYQETQPILLKYKGNNFFEDSGGVWNDGENGSNRADFDEAYVKNKLKSMDFSESRAVKKEKQSVALKISESKKTIKDFLKNLPKQQLNDYCKYLQLPVKGTKEIQAAALSELFKTRPEYILYILEENEFEFLKAVFEQSLEKIDDGIMAVLICNKAKNLGLLDFTVSDRGRQETLRLNIASDIKQDICWPDKKTASKIYSRLKSFSDKLEKLILAYGLIDIPSLYKIFCEIFKENISETEFYRLVYWYASFRGCIETFSTLKGEQFASMCNLDMDKIMKDREKYSDDLTYKKYTYKELETAFRDISQIYEILDLLYEILRFTLKFSENDANNVIDRLVLEATCGKTAEELLKDKSLFGAVNKDISLTCDIWEALNAFILEIPLPMLKGRSRMEYAAEKKISPWSVQMTEENYLAGREKQCHIYEFPAKIQESLWLALEEDKEELEEAESYKNKENIKSEEFLYLLAEACIICSEINRAEKFTVELEKSSREGRRAAKFLWEKIDEAKESRKDSRNNTIIPFRNKPDMDWLAPFEADTQKPFVRNTPKIGRNSPCPCGSGKKYKNCCGR